MIKQTEMDKQEYYEELVASTKQDFSKRLENRRNIELQWRLNMNFTLGNQYSEITPRGDIEDYGKQYFWQEREVFNHIAPIVETRLAKLSRVKAGVSVRPASNEEKDINLAKMSTKILSSITHKNELSKLINKANIWSEITGTCFYKIVWEQDGKNSDAKIVVCPPYEVLPEDLGVNEIENQRSLIHAKVYNVDDIKNIWNVDVSPESVDVLSLESNNILGGLGYMGASKETARYDIENAAIVIEKYIKPSEQYPNGRLIIVAGDELLYVGDLPYMNGASRKRIFPFVKQVAIDDVGSFYGISVVERCIPIQRAYNAVKNRKHEFLNRISMGVLAVEDGSVDTDNLEEEGLSPGKVIVYRQGSLPPRFLEAGNVPNDFTYEEDKLLNEFVMVSGVSEIMKYSKIPSNLNSGIALSLLIEQDDTRMSTTADLLRNAIKEIGTHILRLYHEYAKTERLYKITGDNGELEVINFRGGDIVSDDLVFDTDNELTETPASRRSMALELFKMGILTDENGRMTNRNKTKLLEMLGFGNWENARDLDELHIKKATSENLNMKAFDLPCEIDDHELHIAEHTKYLLSKEYDKHNEKYILEHILAHKQMAYGDKLAQVNEQN